MVEVATAFAVATMTPATLCSLRDARMTLACLGCPRMPGPAAPEEPVWTGSVCRSGDQTECSYVIYIDCKEVRNTQFITRRLEYDT